MKRYEQVRAVKVFHRGVPLFEDETTTTTTRTRTIHRGGSVKLPSPRNIN